MRRDLNYSTLNAPLFWKNVGESTVDGVQPGQISLHPGPGANADAVVLRFVAPVTSVYSVESQFFSGDSGQTEAWVILNGNFELPLASLGVTSINPGFTTTSLELNAGDTIDFVVGNYGDFYFDNTPIEVSITTVPEPHAMWLLLAGIPLIVRRMARWPDA